MDRGPSLLLGLTLFGAWLATPAQATFTETQRLQSFHVQAGEQFGSAVAISGDLSVVCAESRDVAGAVDAGECVLYRLINGSWETNGLLLPSAPILRGNFGHSVALSGDRIVVGAPGRFSSVPARVYVFRRVAADSWVEEAVLGPVPEEPFANYDFGEAVDIDGDVIAIGDPGDNAVYVFRRDGSAWSLEDKLEDGSLDLGLAVAVEGDVLIARSQPNFGGSFHFFQGGNGQWHEKQVEPAPPGTQFANTNSLALQGTLLAVGALGAPGTTLLYEKIGRTWELTQTLVPSGYNRDPGSTVAFAGSMLVIGAPMARIPPPDGSAPGKAYVFHETAGIWAQTDTLIGSDSLGGEAFGASVATDGTHILVGAPLGGDDVTFTRGEAYVFGDSAGNALPIAHAGSDVTVECAGPAGAAVTLDGSASTDADSTAGTNDALISFDWLEGSTSLGFGEVLQVVLPLGSHTVTLRVMDAHGATASDTVVVDIVDTLPPALTVSLAPALLWPPNHRLVDVTASLQVTGVCGASTITLESLTSNEADDAPGGSDGNTAGDIEDADTGTDDRAFRLRAERASGGSGRTYTATYRIVETGVGSVAGAATAFVPLKQNGTADPIVLTLTETASGTRVDWTPAPGAQVYDVIQSRLQDLVATEDAYALGAVQCIERASLDTNTAGFEHAEVPLPGEVFLYAVEYDDVSYGAESAAKPRTVLAGDCP